MQPYPNPNYFMQYQQPQYQQPNPYMQRMERKQKREAEQKRKFTYRLLNKIAYACGIM